MLETQTQRWMNHERNGVFWEILWAEFSLLNTRCKVSTATLQDPKRKAAVATIMQVAPPWWHLSTLSSIRESHSATTKSSPREQTQELDGETLAKWMVSTLNSRTTHRTALQDSEDLLTLLTDAQFTAIVAKCRLRVNNHWFFLSVLLLGIIPGLCMPRRPPPTEL